MSVQSFRLPEEVFEELWYCSCNARTKTQWTQALSAGETFHETVRLVSFRSCTTLVDADHWWVCRMMSSSKNLHTIDFQGCNLDLSQLRTCLARSLPNLSRFVEVYIEGEDEVDPVVLLGFESQIEIVKERRRWTFKSDLNLSGNRIQGKPDLEQLIHSIGRPLRGVGKLNFSNTGVDDFCLPAIVTCFPGLESLHLHATAVRGHNMHLVVRSLPSLTLLDLDKNASLDATGASMLYEAAKERIQSADPPPLEFWIRGVDLTTEWLKLLDICSMPSNSSILRVKHDLQTGVRRQGKQAVIAHENVFVQILLQHCDPVEVCHRSVVCIRGIMDLAGEAISELNLVCAGDTGAVHDRKVMQRRIMYRQEFSDMYESGLISGKQWCVGSVELLRVDTYTGVTSSTWRLHNAILGLPIQGQRVTLRVEAVPKIHR